MKKWISVLMTLVLALAMCTTAFAAPDDAGSETLTNVPDSVDIPVIISVTLPENYYTGPVEDGKADVEGPNFKAHADKVPDGATRLVVVQITEEDALKWFNSCLPDGWGDTGLFYAVWYENDDGERFPANDVQMKLGRPTGYDNLNVHTTDPDGKVFPADRVDVTDDSVSFGTNGKLYYGVTHRQGMVDEVTEVGPGAPDTTLDMTPDELADAVFTDEDRQYIEDGINIHLRLTVEDITDSVSEADKLAVLGVAGDYRVGEYIDIELLKRIGDRNWENIHETRTPVRITVKIPESLLGVAGRTFAIVRVHGNGAQFLDDLDDDPETITFDTDEFSTYAILYRDPAPGPGPGPEPEPEPEPGPKPGPQTGDPSRATPWIALALLTAAATVCTAAYKKKKKR